MKVLIDGVEVKVMNDIRVVYDVDIEDGRGQLQVIANHEGLIYDLFDKDGENLTGTSYDFVSDIVEELESKS